MIGELNKLAGHRYHVPTLATKKNQFFVTTPVLRVRRF